MVNLTGPQFSFLLLLFKVNLKDGQFIYTKDTNQTNDHGYWDGLLEEQHNVNGGDGTKDGFNSDLLLATNPTNRFTESNPTKSSQMYKFYRHFIEEEPSSLDPVFNEILDTGQNNNRKRGALDLYKMVKCGTGCNPLVYKGYGCYCGFLGSGGVVDGIDRCCKMHDWCYSQTTCMYLEYHLPYFFPYKWTCNGGAPYCIAGTTRKTNSASCSHQLCECDREFVECLKQFPCPIKKAMCRSPWRYWQNLFMGLGTGMKMQKPHHQVKSHHVKKQHFNKNRFRVLPG